jgi:hypothetical protein
LSVTIVAPFIFSLKLVKPVGRSGSSRNFAFSSSFRLCLEPKIQSRESFPFCGFINGYETLRLPPKLVAGVTSAPQFSAGFLFCAAGPDSLSLSTPFDHSSRRSDLAFSAWEQSAWSNGNVGHPLAAGAWKKPPAFLVTVPGAANAVSPSGRPFRRTITRPPSLRNSITTDLPRWNSQNSRSVPSA